MIPMTECVKGHLYAIRSRNLSFGVYDGDEGFVGIREKFGDLFLFTEFHYDQGPPFGTVTPIVDMGECPIKDLRESWSGGCSVHGRPTVYDKTKPKLNPYASDGRMYPGTWCHSDDGSEMPKGDSPTSKHNAELFDWLTKVEQDNDWYELTGTERIE